MKIQNPTKSAGPALSSQFDNPQVSLIRTKCWGQKCADYWKFTVHWFYNATEIQISGELFTDNETILNQLLSCFSWKAYGSKVCFFMDHIWMSESWSPVCWKQVVYLPIDNAILSCLCHSNDRKKSLSSNLYLYTFIILH